ncbi:MAG: sensor histidine kinase, partial [Chitinophagaceae bacterium]
IQIYTFDEDGTPLGNRDTTSIASLNSEINFKSRPTSSPDLYILKESFGHYSYIGKLEIFDPLDGNKIIGYLIYILTPKVLKNETLYPQLLVDNDVLPAGFSNIYFYAVYDHQNLVSHHNDYPFTIKISHSEIPTKKFAFRDNGEFSELWYNAGGGIVVVVAKAKRNFIEGITLFAYMFCIFLVIAAVYRILDILIKSRLNMRNLKQLLNINIRRQVHGTIIFIVIFAFLILGIATIYFFDTRYDKNHQEALSKNINIIGGDVGSAFRNQLMFNEMSNIYDPVILDKLQNAIVNIGKIHQVDINVYDLDGNLRITTQPLIYNKGLLSRKMDPVAYYQLNNLDKIQYIQYEHVGKLKFLSSYIPIRQENGETVAYLNLPYFASQNDLNQEISNFLIALINLNAFIFLLSGILALLITNSITRSFTLIIDRLQQINLVQSNKIIEWNRNDEIGQLVKEYNKMVRKLEIGAASLAKSEREGAWREMARQVAHEIKNPLTPMKLSLQYLQKAINDDALNVKELTVSVAGTLIEQIEHLSQIASDFSAFANISGANGEVILFNEVLNSVISLYQSDPRHLLLYDPPTYLFYIFADKTEINRLFTNLLQNAIQSIPEERPGLISIHVLENDNKIRVSISDNGIGIPEEFQSKIFMPNFTTKSSGTGLGLAMCGNIVERIKGKIWFETRVGKGTTFFVEIPLVDKKSNTLDIS